MNKEFIFEFKNDWRFLFGKYNWTTFTFADFYVEHEKWLKAWSMQFTLLGLGVYIRLNYDVKFLKKKIKEWESDREFTTYTEYKLDEYTKKVMEEGAEEMNDFYMGQLNAIADIKKLLADEDEELDETE